MIPEPNDGHDLYESLATELCEMSGVARGTMMGFPCLRANDAFFASLEPKTGHLIVKLPAHEVSAIVTSNHGLAFAPSGRTFREWVAIPVPDEDTWRDYLLRARSFVTS